MQQAKPETKAATANSTHSCCKEESKASDIQVSEGKPGCHCIKSFPAQLPNKLDSATTIVGVDLVLIENVSSLATVVQPDQLRQKISFTGSGPPFEPFLSHHSGRAPPVSVE